jgi:hypothetical protein
MLLGQAPMGMDGASPCRDPSQVNQLQLYRPSCSKCGGLTTLVRIEPAASADHDGRTFQCTVCGDSDTHLVKFK